MMNAMQAKKMMKEDCQDYMISVQEIREDEPRLEEIPIVREYLEVFPEELPGLPPSRELDFGIELVAGTNRFCRLHIDWRQQRCQSWKI